MQLFLWSRGQFPGKFLEPEWTPHLEEGGWPKSTRSPEGVGGKCRRAETNRGQEVGPQGSTRPPPSESPPRLQPHAFPIVPCGCREEAPR